MTRSQTNPALPVVTTSLDPSPSSEAVLETAGPVVEDEERIDWLGSTGFLLMHVAALGVLLVGITWTAVVVCLITYYLRVFALTGGYHRYFSHRTYKTSRWFQFVLAWLGASAAQMGPLWWAAHHRHHHKYSDTEQDIHSPRRRGFLWAHMGWVLCRKYVKTNLKAIPDFARFPELRFINRFHMLPALALALVLLGVGYLIETHAPVLNTTMWQVLMCGFFLSTVLLYHATFCINSLAHVFGRRRFATRDDSRNNWFLSVLTMGEGWHNNHHRYPFSEQQGLYWWEFDPTHYMLKFLGKVGIVWDINKPPRELYDEVRAQKAQPNR
jgi:stearoyl-CoA desaturase (Delta-9 desaturase)